MDNRSRRITGGAYRRKQQMVSLHAKEGKDRTKAKRKTHKPKKGA